MATSNSNARPMLPACVYDIMVSRFSPTIVQLNDGVVFCQMRCATSHDADRREHMMRIYDDVRLAAWNVLTCPPNWLERVLRRLEFRLAVIKAQS